MLAGSLYTMRQAATVHVQDRRVTGRLLAADGSSELAKAHVNCFRADCKLQLVSIVRNYVRDILSMGQACDASFLAVHRRR